MGKFMILYIWDANIQLWIWQFVQDPFESLAVIGRYISENYDGVALHPIDFIDTSTGKLVAEVMDTDVTTITPVNKLHPHEYILASGSSRFFILFVFVILSVLTFDGFNYISLQNNIDLEDKTGKAREEAIHI